MSSKEQAPSSSVLFGCAGARGPVDAYARRFTFLEIDLAQPIKQATLRKIRRDAGPPLSIGVIVPKALAAVRPTPELEAALTETLEAQRELQARWILLATPVEVTPGALARERLAKVVERIREGLGAAAPSVHIAWQPRGVWEPEAAAAFAEKLGVALCMDPLIDPNEPFWDPSIRYVRLSTVGGRNELSPARLRAIAELVLANVDEEAEDDAAEPPIAVVFATPHAPREAKRFGSLLRALQSSGGGHRRVAARDESDLGFDDGDDEEDGDVDGDDEEESE